MPSYETLTPWLLSTSVQVALLVCVVWFLTLACRNCSARLRHGLWLLVLIKVFLPPSLSAPWSVGNLPRPALTQALPALISTSEVTVALPAGAPGPHAITSESHHPSAVAKALAPAAAPNALTYQLTTYLPALWIAGLLIYLASVAIPYFVLLRRLNRAFLVDEGPLAIKYQALAMQLAPNRTPPRLLVSSEVHSPFLVGFVHPAVVMPQSYATGFTDNQMEHVLLHELTHWRRRDVLVGWVQVVAQALLWFHPLLWFANSRLREEREAACDEEVIAHKQGTARSYADTLLQVLLVSRGRSLAVPGFLGIFERSTRLQKRLEQIMMQEQKAHRFGWVGHTGVAIVGLLLLPMAGTKQANADITESSSATTSTVAIEDDKFPTSKLDEAQRAWLAKDQKFSDSLLNELQQAWLDWTSRQFGPDPTPDRYASNTDAERAEMETRFLTILEGPENQEVHGAINGLAALRSKKAIAPLKRIATERRDKHNRGRWMAIRALSLVGERSLVSDLIHLSYHPNQNTRLWAQIALVRLTGQNFAYDWKAWCEWWNGQGGHCSSEQVEWIQKPEDMKYMDTQLQQQNDQEFLAKYRANTSQTTTASNKSAPADTTPPSLIHISPAPGSTDVDLATTAIVVTFDRDMGPGMSWTGGGPDFPVPPAGEKPQWQSSRTCVFPVKLEPGKFYRVGVNSTSYQNFKSADGIPAEPVSIYFSTMGADAHTQARGRKPAIVSMTPPNNATNVSPSLTEIRVVFSTPMGGGFSWTGGGDDFPKIPEGKAPAWSADRKTCTLPVELKPNHEYRLGLNSVSHKNFTSEAGVPLDPVEYRFKTSN